MNQIHCDSGTGVTGTALTLISGEMPFGGKGQTPRAEDAGRFEQEESLGTGVSFSPTYSCVFCATSNRDLTQRPGSRKGQVTTVPNTHDIFTEDFLEEAMTGMDRERRQDQGLQGAWQSPVR